MEPNERIADGFFLALHLIDSLGVVYDRDALLRKLAEVAAGEASVFNSPTEELATLEKQRDRPSLQKSGRTFCSASLTVAKWTYTTS